MPITVYTKPACVQCNATKRWLDENKFDYDLVDITQDEEALNRFKELGYSSAPVVETATGVWAGFRPELLAELR